MDEVAREVVDEDQRIVNVAIVGWKNTYCARKGDGFDTQGRRFKWYEWDRLSSGDCFMYPNARLTLWDDGTAHWKAGTQSSDTNDEWNSRFDFFDANGTHLFTTPAQQGSGGTWYFIHMNQAYVAYSWEKDWSYNKSFFDSISNAKMDYSC